MTGRGPGFAVLKWAVFRKGKESKKLQGAPAWAFNWLKWVVKRRRLVSGTLREMVNPVFSESGSQKQDLFDGKAEKMALRPKRPKMGVKTLRTVSVICAALFFGFGWMPQPHAYSADADSPECQLTFSNPGPPPSFGVAISAADTGLQALRVVSVENADVLIPPFSPGITSPVVVTVTGISEDAEVSVTLEARDIFGNATVCTFPALNEPPPPDVTPPSCELSTDTVGPPTRVRFAFIDSGSGLANVEVMEAVNVNVSVPTLVPETTEAVQVIGTKLDEAREMRLSLSSVDGAGNETVCRYPSGDEYFDVRPEFDAVGLDSSCIFADYFTDQVAEKGLDHQGYKVNDYSAFEETEYFNTTAGQLNKDPCFSTPSSPYMSALVPTWTEGIYEWQVVLQLQPTSDIQLTITHCVLKTDETNAWRGAEQTGRYRASWGEIFFVPTANPRVTAVALPGPNATPGFPDEGFYLDARHLPGLSLFPIVAAVGTAGTFSAESILIALPQTGVPNASGQTAYALNAGDRIRVTVRIPANNTCNIRYGKDNVLLKYIGLVDTEYTTR